MYVYICTYVYISSGTHVKAFSYSAKAINEASIVIPHNNFRINSCACKCMCAYVCDATTHTGDIWIIAVIDTRNLNFDIEIVCLYAYTYLYNGTHTHIYLIDRVVIDGHDFDFAVYVIMVLESICAPVSTYCLLA